MAADVELRLISRAIRERNLVPLIDLGVDDTWWLGDDALQLWRFAKDHYVKYGECPTSVVVKDALPGYRLLKVDDGMPYLIDTFLGLRRYAQTIEMLQDAGDLVQDGHHEAALVSLSSALLRMESTAEPSSRDLDVTAAEDMPGVVDRYMELSKLEGGMRGFPTGFPTIDRATSGLQRQQLITIIAPPKVGKSTLALAIARNVHRLVDRNVLFCSFEMSNPEQEARYLAMVGGVGHTDLTTGHLSKKDEKQLRARLDATAGGAKLVLTDAPSAASLTGLAAKIDKHHPDLVFVDGVYLMQDEVTGESNTPQALTNLTRGLKKMAQRFDIPIVISTQVLLWKMRKGQVAADAIGYSSSFYQDSDVILGLQEVPDDQQRRQLKVVDSRNCPKVSAYLDWDWRTTTFTEESDGVLDMAALNDDEDDD